MTFLPIIVFIGLALYLRNESYKSEMTPQKVRIRK
jgi:hypothetical protein